MKPLWVGRVYRVINIFHNFFSSNEGFTSQENKNNRSEFFCGYFILFTHYSQVGLNDVLTSYKYAFLLYVKFQKLVKSGKFIAREVRKTI